MKRTILLVAVLLSGLVLMSDVDGQRRKTPRQTQPKTPPSKPAPTPTPTAEAPKGAPLAAEQKVQPSAEQKEVDLLSACSSRNYAACKELGAQWKVEEPSPVDALNKRCTTAHIECTMQKLLMAGARSGRVNEQFLDATKATRESIMNMDWRTGSISYTQQAWLDRVQELKLLATLGLAFITWHNALTAIDEGLQARPSKPSPHALAEELAVMKQLIAKHAETFSQAVFVPVESAGVSPALRGVAAEVVSELEKADSLQKAVQPKKP